MLSIFLFVVHTICSRIKRYMEVNYPNYVANGCFSEARRDSLITHAGISINTWQERSGESSRCLITVYYEKQDDHSAPMHATALKAYDQLKNTTLFGFCTSTIKSQRGSNTSDQLDQRAD